MCVIIFLDQRGRYLQSPPPGLSVFPLTVCIWAGKLFREQFSLCHSNPRIGPGFLRRLRVSFLR